VPEREHLSELRETRTKILQIQGKRALGALRKWAEHNLDVRLPDSCIAKFDVTIESLEEHRLKDAALQVTDAAKLLVRDAPYDSLLLQEAARIACLVSELIEFSDVFAAYRSHELTAHSRGAMADNVVGVVARHGGKIDDLVSLLTEVFYYYNDKLGVPEDVSLSELQSLLTDELQSADLPGIALALWAATHGHLVRFSNAIQDGVASIVANRTWNLDEDTEQYHLAS